MRPDIQKVEQEVGFDSVSALSRSSHVAFDHLTSPEAPPAYIDHERISKRHRSPCHSLTDSRCHRVLDRFRIFSVGCQNL